MTWVSDVLLRQTAFAIEQMAPGGIEGPEPGQLEGPDLERAFTRVDDLIRRPKGLTEARRATLLQVRDRTGRLEELLRAGGHRPLVYVDPEVFGLEPRLRSTALEIDFSFGDKDGRLSPADIDHARFHYGQVRGPVGWNRLLLTDEIEHRLFPERTLRSTEGSRLRPSDWIGGPPNPLARLEEASGHLDDAALARTYADIAARLACTTPGTHRFWLYEQGLKVLGAEIRRRGSIRPTITDIARIGCEDPDVRSSLKSPIEMSRRLKPAALLDRFLR